MKLSSIIIHLVSRFSADSHIYFLTRLLCLVRKCPCLSTIGGVAAATAGGVVVMLQYRQEKQHFREQFTKERSIFLHI